MFRKFHEKRQSEEGFTLIELLVVILIIAILAAIAIPVFLKQREKGWIAAMESALKNGATAAESFATGPGDGNYASGTPEAAVTQTQLETEGWKRAADINGITINTSTDFNKYCIQVSHAKYNGPEEPMAISSEQTTPKPGTCVAGVWTAPATP